jgi:CRISPR-associated protein (TIGR03986 family)
VVVGGGVVTEVVVLSWDPGSREIGYVEVNGGSGSAELTYQASAEEAEQFESELAGLVFPRTAELLIDGNSALVIASEGSGVVLCRVRAVGSPENRRFELRPRKSGGVAATIATAELGIADGEAASAAAGFDYLYTPELRPPGCWVCEGGMDVWLTRRQEELAARRSARAQAQERQAAEERAKARFVNPYTFVPFPERIDRRRPPGHAWLAPDGLSGTFTVTWTFTSPFQAPDGAASAAELRLPGSSVKGAVRSVHEALAGGCLRIFDENFVPSYRDAATVRSAEWALAVVTDATFDGQPLSVQLCDDVVWVRLAQLRAAWGSRLATGARVTIPEQEVPAAPNSLGRKELGEDVTVQRDGDWVVLVTSPGTRSARKGTYYLACGRLGEQKAEVSDDAWRAFRLAVAGAEDLRRAVREAAGAGQRDLRPTEPVRFGSQPVGTRRVVTGRLWPDDVVWVRTSETGDGGITVGEISLAAIWRHPGWDLSSPADDSPGDWLAGARIPRDLLACDDPWSLCPSCRVFGSTDQNERGRGDRAAQRAYAGHVRFGEARSAGPVELTGILRAPLGAPRPGAGQFYLAYDDPSPAASRTARPTREWGAAPDIPARRRLRGRKFYWHADPAAQQGTPRYAAREHQKDSKGVTSRRLAPAGTVLRQQVSFDNLSRADLGGLLAALEPQRVLADTGHGPPRLHLGGGKPLGLGSCTATVSGLRVWDAAARYGGGPGIEPEPDAYAREFAGQCPDGVTSTWPALAAVLAEATVDPALVWYPPGALWSDREDGEDRDASEERFDESFSFFAATSGMYLKDKPARTLIPLPAPDSGDQSLPIVPKDDAR